MNKAPSTWRPLRGLPWYRGVGVLVVLLMLGLSTLPIGGVGPALPHADKLQHAMAYLVLTVWFAQLVEEHARCRLALVLFGIGLTVEVLQSTLPWRSAEIADLLANGSGIALGLLATRGRGARLLEALEARSR